jgi:ubiquinone/menaquinone biosynthesis C-methylase UbiE
MNRDEILQSARRLLSRGTFEFGAISYAFLTSSPTWREHGGLLATFAGVRPGDRVLDLGCGPGVSAFGMLDRAPDIEVIGLDLSHMMLRIAELQKRRERHGDKVTFIRADATALPFPDHSFDAVVGHSFLYLLPEPDRVLAEVRRVLRPGRRCAFLEPSDDTFRTIVPLEILAMTPNDPRFVAAMVLWRFYSRSYGRFDEDRFASLFGKADLTLVDCRRTLSGIGYFGVGERPEERRAE